VFTSQDGLLPVPSGTEAAAFDRAAYGGGIPEGVLLENAGRAGADYLETHFPKGPVVVLAGTGHNGGDAVVLARTLFARGRDVRLLVDPARPNPDPLLHGHPVPTALLPSTRGALATLWAPHGTPAPSLVVDGLLGTGLKGAPRGFMVHWIEGLNELAEAQGLPVVALDLPSGVLADSGGVPGVAVKAAVTLAFGAPKLGTILHPGRAHAGGVAVLEIGFPPWPRDAARGALITGRWARSVYPFRPSQTHKNASGRLLLLAGGASMAGAALLAASAALRSGVGMLRVLTAPEHRELFHAALPEAILPDPTDPEAVRAALAASDAVVAGPGMGLTDEALPGALLGGLLQGLTEKHALLLDADALTRLGAGAFSLPLAVPPERRLLTPHPGELRRIHPALPEGMGTLSSASAAAARWGAVCLLKGTPSVLASAPGEGGPVWISASGASLFARGGMGDVLAGVAGAFLARGCSAMEAGGLALHLTGRAADHLLDQGLGADAILPSDLVTTLPAVLEELRGATPPTAGSWAGRDASHPPSLGLHLAPPR
jgi:ADP-dependent NAD(P)H-hydrate dehydratase / NAD(P)H-hydrate epimerase